MRRAVWMALAIAALLGAALAAPAGAQGAFGFKSLAVQIEDREGAAETEAGAHPFAIATTVEVNVDGEGEPEGWFKDLEVDLPAGLVGDPGAVPTCSAAEFLTTYPNGHPLENQPTCPDASALGYIGARAPGEATISDFGVAYNLEPAPGTAAKLGFRVLKAFITIDLGVRPHPPYNAYAKLSNIGQIEPFVASELVLWGNPADPVHDAERGGCFLTPAEDTCGVSIPERPFLTLPRSCTGPLITTFRARSWEDPGAEVVDRATSPQIDECQRLDFDPTISSRLSTDRAASPSGLDFGLAIDDEGLVSPAGIADSDIQKAEVTLPEGVTVNPALAEGLAACSAADLARESLDPTPGQGCPQASKVGEVRVRTPLLEETLHGQVYVAAPFDNPFDSLLALYMVIEDPGLGILVKLAGRVAPDPGTGRLTTTFGEPGHQIPQFPFSDFRFRFRSGARSPLISPPECGAHTTTALFTPWAYPARTLSEAADTSIAAGPRGGPCPAVGALPFAPGFEAGSLNNQAGAHSAFSMRMTRADGEQDITRFDAVLPPGLAGKLAGVPWCPEAAIARARGRDGKDELARPSCPPASRIGSTLAGAGAGPELTYVPGSLYLAGPFGGAPLSVVAITPAVAGPFDVGTVVVREALRLDPVTAAVSADGASSDPIPHLLEGIPLALRELRVEVDRPGFVLNPTSCAPSRTAATIFGGGSFLDPGAGETPLARAARFQAAGCRGLGFEPRLAIKLKGGVKRGANPALRAHVRPRPGDANFSRAVVTLPRSAFLEQAHIRTICTRVQFHAPPGHGAHCPPGARYGFARAWSPLVAGPVQGPVYLRSSDNNLPDLVAALTGPPSARVQVELSARIDSVKGGIRSTFATIPDLPVSRFILDMQGGKKGLIVNSRHLCHKPKRNRAKANLRGQNGRLHRAKPRVIAVKCQKRRKSRRAALSAAWRAR